jgi:predicted N-acyltransferase
MPTLTTHSAIDEIPAADWNRLVDPDTPFLRHEFLAAMEHHGCVGQELGWIPRHIALREGGALVAAAPCYVKLNSYGELVFDWSWADAYRRQGMAYYPKLVVASPYTPANGPRILVAPGLDAVRHGDALIQGATEVARQMGVSSLHWLFTTEEETDRLTAQGLMARMGCQFHWENRGYGRFDDLLGEFSAGKRKNVKRERRRVAEEGVTFRVLRGSEVEDREWQVFHALYRSTFDKRGGLPTLSLGFFREIARTMGDSLLLILAVRHREVIAGAFCLVGSCSLYGRHWGCFQEVDNLHFETCYYQGLDFCIREGLARFEPGAQGEHKVSRGFLPRRTWSAHWIADPRMGSAIGRFLALEREGMEDYLSEMHERSPFKTEPEPRFGT